MDTDNPIARHRENKYDIEHVTDIRQHTFTANYRGAKHRFTVRFNVVRRIVEIFIDSQQNTPFHDDIMKTATGSHFEAHELLESAIEAKEGYRHAT